jgi:hypothetical protein
MVPRRKSTAAVAEQDGERRGREVRISFDAQLQRIRMGQRLVGKGWHGCRGPTATYAGFFYILALFNLILKNELGQFF